MAEAVIILTRQMIRQILIIREAMVQLTSCYNVKTGELNKWQECLEQTEFVE